jgi:xanthine dehydrogenase YagT iron-sulfur-binding subunit
MSKHRDPRPPRDPEVAPDPGPADPGLSRRGFMSVLGAGAVGSVVSPKALVPAGPRVVAAGDTVTITLDVNGRSHRVAVESRWTLLHVLREVLGLTGTKPGCERGECGACTVLVDGRPRPSCLMLAVEAEGAVIETIEGVARRDQPSVVAHAFVEHDGFQCGYCTPGQVLAAEGLLRANPSPTAEDIRVGMSGNLCRCGAYPHIHEAVAAAAVAMKGGKS